MQCLRVSFGLRRWDGGESVIVDGDDVHVLSRACTNYWWYILKNNHKLNRILRTIPWVSGYDACHAMRFEL